MHHIRKYHKIVSAQENSNLIIQSMIVRTDVLIMPVLHPEPSGNDTKLNETKPFIKMPGMDVALHNSVELENTEPKLLRLLQAIQHQFFTDINGQDV